MSLLNRIARHYASEHPHDLSRYSFVFSNRRAGLFFRKALAAELRTPVFAPETLTVNECFAAFSDLRTADRMTLLLYLYEDYCSLWHESVLAREGGGNIEPFDTFLFWGNMMLADFSEADNHLVPDVGKMFTVVSDIKQIDSGFDYLDEEQRESLLRFWEDYRLSKSHYGDEFHQPFLRVWSFLAPLYNRFCEHLRREGLAYEGMLHRDAVERLKADKVPLPDKKFVFVGFNALSASEREMMLLLKKRGLAEVCFDYDAPLLQRADCRASLFMQRNLDDFGTPAWLDIEASTGQEVAPMPEVTLVGVPSYVAETFEVHRILSEIADDHAPDANGQGTCDWTRTAVVLPDEHLLLPMLRSVPEAVPTVNVSMGFPLGATALWALVENLFLLQESYRRGSFYYRDMLAVLRAPLLAARFSAENADRLIAKVMRDRCLFLSEKTIPAVVMEKQDEKDMETVNPVLVSAVFRHVDNAAGMLDYLFDILDILQEGQDRIDEPVYVLQKALNKTRNAFALYPDIAASMERSTFFSLLRLMLQDAAIPFAGEPLKGLQVLGVLETRALDFDNVIITCFNDEQYPGRSHAATFIPYNIRKAFGLPLPERQDAVFAYNFYHLFSNARRVWFVSNTFADDQNTGEPSRFLKQLRYQFGVEVREEHVQFLPKTVAEPETDIPKTAEVLRILKEKIGTKGLSASAVNNYFYCQCQFYFSYVCGLREPAEVSDDISATDFGTWFHMIMEEVYKPYCGKQVTAHDIAGEITGLKNTIASIPGLDAVRSNRLLMNVLERYAENLLRLDMRIAPFTIESLELDCRCMLPLSDGGTALLTGKIDRVDSLADGTLRIIDYKTGSGDTEFVSIPDLFGDEEKTRNKYALQTLFYCLMYKDGRLDNIEPHLFVVRKVSADDKVSTLVHMKGGTSLKWKDVRDDYTAALDSFIVSELLNPEKNFKRIERKNSGDYDLCANCAFLNLCGRA